LAEASAPRRRLVAVGQKSYLTYAETAAWLRAAAGPAQEFAEQVDVVVFPVTPALPLAVELGRFGTPRGGLHRGAAGGVAG